MYRARQKKIHDREGCPMLRHFEMQKIIDEVNGTQEEEQKSKCNKTMCLNMPIDNIPAHCHHVNQSIFFTTDYVTDYAAFMSPY